MNKELCDVSFLPTGSRQSRCARFPGLEELRSCLDRSLPTSRPFWSQLARGGQKIREYFVLCTCLFPTQCTIIFNDLPRRHQSHGRLRQNSAQSTWSRRCRPRVGIWEELTVTGDGRQKLHTASVQETRQS